RATRPERSSRSTAATCCSDERPAMSTLLVAAVLLAAAPDAGAPPDVHPPGRELTVLGKKIWVEDEGTGPVLLLIPGGGGGSHDYFHPWLRPLARGLRVVTYDGFGRG